MTVPGGDGKGAPRAPGKTIPIVEAPDEPTTLRVSPASVRDTEVAPQGLGLSPPPRLVQAQAEPLTGFDDDASRYEVAGILGEGGMGEVRLCHDRRIGRDVAMKIAKMSAGSHPDLVVRFLREVRIQGQLEHPGIVPVYDLGTDAAGRTVFTMKRVRGRTLEDIIEDLRGAGPTAAESVSRRQLLGAFSRACMTIAFAHSRGVIHRDLKPANVMLGDFGEVYVLDWGIAKIATDDAGPVSSRGAEPRMVDDPNIGKTEVGSLLGTPGYMAPEQARGELDVVGPAADVYALGAILFELLALTPLHEGTRTNELVVSTLRGAEARPSVRARGRAVPPELDAVCVRATAAAAKDRYASARELSETLDRYLDGERDLERRRELAVTHVQAARAALGDGSTESQRSAVRELGQALALDPTHREALAALRGMVLDPDDRLPPEAEEELGRIDKEDRARSAIRIGLSVLGFPLSTPLVVWMGVRDVRLLVVLLALGFMQVSYALFMGLTRRAEPRFMRWFIPFGFMANASIVVFLGPYILAPVLTVLTAATFLVSLRPNPRTRRLIFLSSIVAVALPPLLDGLLYRSTSFEGGQIRILPMLSDFPELPTRVALLVANLGMVIVANFLIGQAVSRIVDLERRNFTQAWRLRHLLPEGAPDEGASGEQRRAERAASSAAPPRGARSD